MSSIPLIQRVNYFSGEALLTEDFSCEQQYHMAIQSLNNQSLYTYGIASGLDVYWDSESNANQVQVGAGMAIDATGRQIILSQSQIVKLADIVAGATYFLTISFNQVYADYSSETGVSGYKRIVEQPLLQYVRNLQQPGTHILLAVLGFTTQGNINQLTYRSGSIERRYVGSTLGALNFVTEGAGVHKLNVSPTLSGFLNSPDNPDYPSIKARKESTGDTAYLEVNAPRSQFSGLLTTRNNLGIGIDQPMANLQVDAITFKGVGVISSDGQIVTLSQTVTPYFEIGDQLISDPPVVTMNNGYSSFGLPQQRTIIAINPEKLQVTVAKAFDPALQSISYTYIRSTLARFGVANDSSLLRINIDGTVGLGMQASISAGLVASGPNTLVITPDRKVGIALSDRMPTAALDVNGQIQADQLNVTGQIQSGSMIVNGPIQAQSFEGNGSKLQGLPMLSYWTRETIGTPSSNLYYNDGNVGIRDKKPLASLSVGGGQSFIGTGLVTAITDNVLQGYQTAFKDQVTVGDTITVGMLIKQISVIAQIVSDTELVLQEQMPIAVSSSAFTYQAPGADPQPGQGLVSSNGTRLIGVGTAFNSTAVVGGKIIIARFDVQTNVSQSSIIDAVAGPTALTLRTAFAADITAASYSYQTAGGPVVKGPGTISTKGKAVSGDQTDFSALKSGDQLIIAPSSTLPQTMFVKEVLTQNQLSLILPDGNGDGNINATFPAAVSAYVVTPSLLAYVAANSDNGVLPNTSSSIPPAMIIATNNRVDTPNTVAINYRPEEIQSRYALQVNGDAHFTSGSLIVTDLQVETLEASKSVSISGDGSASNLLEVREGSDAPLLAVTKTNVVIGASSADNQLQVTGNVYASGNLVSAAMVKGAGLSGGALQVAGTTIDNKGVQIIGTRVAYDQSALTNSGTTFSQQASTDGYVMATIGQPSWNSNYCGSLAGVTTDAGGNQTSFVYATGIAYEYDVPAGKKGSNTIHIPVPGAFTMPVKQGETWTLTLTWVADVGNAPQIEFYWIPLGSSSTSVNAMAAPATLPNGGMAATLQQLRDDLATGRISSSLQASAQQTIQRRVDDLTQILGDATHMSSNAEDRAKFIADLQKIVCSPARDSQVSEAPDFEQSMTHLIDTFGSVTGHQFTTEQRGLLAAGVRALVQINDSPANRRDLTLIKNNINLFLDNVEQVLQARFDTNQRRLLTRALVRLVGDGSGAADGG
jgi:trimeric autotransporter adhesin